MANCFFCDTALKFDPQHGRFGNTALISRGFDCGRCGDYFYIYPDIGQTEVSIDDKTKIAAYLQEQRLNNYDGRIVIADNENVKSAVLNFPRQPQSKAVPVVTVKELLDRFPKMPSEKINMALQNLSRASKTLGYKIAIDSDNTDVSNKSLPFFYAIDYNEMVFIIKALEEDGYVKIVATSNNRHSGVAITPKGYDRIYELGKINPTSNQAFVAMWFDSSMDNAYKNGFAKAIEDAGYESKRIDKKDFLGKIDDEIMAEIRRSRFLIADFTGFRTGVFYESGFAKGLGIDVIFTCREDQKDKIKEHFDTRQEKHITWKDEPDLYNQLLNSITANIGWGPKAKKEESK